MTIPKSKVKSQPQKKFGVRPQRIGGRVDLKSWNLSAAEAMQKALVKGITEAIEEALDSDDTLIHLPGLWEASIRDPLTVHLQVALTSDLHQRVVFSFSLRDVFGAQELLPQKGLVRVRDALQRLVSKITQGLEQSTGKRPTQ
jgi:hypothetical protein